LGIWLTHLALGFEFVNRVTNYSNKSSLFYHQRWKRYSDFLGLMVLGIILFLIGPMLIIKGEADLEGFCDDENSAHQSQQEIMKTKENSQIHPLNALFSILDEI
jgi:Na+/H+ antiporter NhaC